VLKKKIWANFQRIIELFTKKIVKKLLKIWSWDPGCGKNLFRIPNQGVKKAPDPGSATLPGCCPAAAASGRPVALPAPPYCRPGLRIRNFMLKVRIRNILGFGQHLLQEDTWLEVKIINIFLMCITCIRKKFERLSSFLETVPKYLTIHFRIRSNFRNRIRIRT
jgi:hypothetical protein